jgi:hypothetical protein
LLKNLEISALMALPDENWFKFIAANNIENVLANEHQSGD